MPLSPFQKRVFKVIAQNRSPDSYVAGATVNPASLEGLDLAKPLDPQATKAEWLAALERARSAMTAFPPLTLGFLFLDKKNGSPVRNSIPLSDWVAHRGSVKGAWPQLVT